MPYRDPTSPTSAGLALLIRIQEAGGRLTVRRRTPGSPDRLSASIQTIRALASIGCVVHDQQERGLVVLDLTSKGLAEIGRAARK